MSDKSSFALRLLRWCAHDPLVHFLALGALIFAAYAVLTPSPDAARQIIITQQDLERLREISLKQWGGEPDAKILNALLQTHLREEVLYREAIAQGLDRDDMVVRRRLAEKMDFLFSEDARTPDDAETLAHFTAHAAEFKAPAQVDLEQVYFSTSQNPDTAQKAAQQALSVLQRGGSVAGDNFMLARQLPEQTQASLEKEFGPDFAAAVMAQPPGNWVGPLASAQGLHLVKVLRHEAERPARFEEVRERLKTDLANAAIEKARNDRYQQALARYTVTLPAKIAPAAPGVRP